MKNKLITSFNLILLLVINIISGYVYSKDTNPDVNLEIKEQLNYNLYDINFKALASKQPRVMSDTEKENEKFMDAVGKGYNYLTQELSEVNKVSDTEVQVKRLLKASERGYSYTNASDDNIITEENIKKYLENYNHAKPAREILNAVKVGWSPTRDPIDHINLLAKVDTKNSYKAKKEKNQYNSHRCENKHKPFINNLNVIFENDSEIQMYEDCLKNRNDFSVQCVYLLSKVAVTSFSNENECADGRVSVKKMMCIFTRESMIKNGNFGNECNSNGCGMAQMTGTSPTSGGSAVVTRGITIFNLGKGFDNFWSLVGRSEERGNKCKLNRNSAKDRDTSIIMAATHLCAQAKDSPNATNQFLSCEYNLGGSDCKSKNGKTDYSRGIENCEKAEIWNMNLEILTLEQRAICLTNNSCPYATDKIKTDSADSSPSNSSAGSL